MKTASKVLHSALRENMYMEIIGPYTYDTVWNSIKVEEVRIVWRHLQDQLRTKRSY